MATCAGVEVRKQAWLLDKYARLVASREPSALSLSQDQGEGSSWQVKGMTFVHFEMQVQLDCILDCILNVFDIMILFSSITTLCLASRFS